MTPKHHNLYITLTSIILLALIISLSLYLISNDSNSNGGGDVFVYEVVDGDTFKMSDGTKVRLLCVDTPERGEEGYDRATKFLESIILYREVRLEKGETLDEVDKYSRDLRFVYVNTPNGEVFVNAEIVRLGFGDLFPYEDVEGECAITLGQ